MNAGKSKVMVGSSSSGEDYCRLWKVYMGKDCRQTLFSAQYV